MKSQKQQHIKITEWSSIKIEIGNPKDNTTEETQNNSSKSKNPHTIYFTDPNQKQRFKNYLQQTWEHRKIIPSEHGYVEETEDLEEPKKVKEGFFTWYDEKITSKQYVGVLCFENITIEIIPKMIHYENKNWWHNLLFWLEYTNSIALPFNKANLDTYNNQDSFLEILISIFAYYTEPIISHQPYQNYQSVTEETNFLKGSLDIPKYIQNNLITGRWHTFTCNYKPFILDNRLNQIIKYVTTRLLTITKENYNREKLESILFILNEVGFRECTINDCNQVHLNIIFEEYQIILDMCKMYLSNSILDLQNYESNHFCFLLPMNRIFESFISEFLKQEFKENSTASKKEEFLCEKNNEPTFKLKPDIIYKNKSEDHQIIIDTKYKDRSKAGNNDKKAGVSQADMYQMLTYATAFDIHRVVLLYPKAQETITPNIDTASQVTAENNNTRNHIEKFLPNNNYHEQKNLGLENIKQKLTSILSKQNHNTVEKDSKNNIYKFNNFKNRDDLEIHICEVDIIAFK